MIFSKSLQLENLFPKFNSFNSLYFQKMLLSVKAYFDRFTFLSDFLTFSFSEKDNIMVLSSLISLALLSCVLFLPGLRI